MKEVTFVLPAYNEEESIGNVLEDINLTYPKSKVIVVDNNSTDNTASIAENAGALLISEKKQGKGHAVKKGFQHVKSKFAIMIDADNTYYPREAGKLLIKLKNDEADVVLGSRLNGIRKKGAITPVNLFGNYILSLTASLLFSNISDVCTGYWAFKKEVIDYLLKEGINSDGFELEAEMFSVISKKGFKILEIPINYGTRVDSPKLNSVNDGWKIFKTLLVCKLQPTKSNYYSISILYDRFKRV
ncbi:glycosyltransferase family 2 protein [Methanobacterium sp.]|uniref:glycosyltransferase family 2 protein n=1 Tax=Methanobacterium sp. TaxID=2164 RepID=UPI003C7965A4